MSSINANISIIALMAQIKSSGSGFPGQGQFSPNNVEALKNNYLKTVSNDLLDGQLNGKAFDRAIVAPEDLQSYFKTIITDELDGNGASRFKLDGSPYDQLLGGNNSPIALPQGGSFGSPLNAGLGASPLSGGISQLGSGFGSPLAGGLGGSPLGGSPLGGGLSSGLGSPSLGASPLSGGLSSLSSPLAGGLGGSPLGGSPLGGGLSSGLGSPSLGASPLGGGLGTPSLGSGLSSLGSPSLGSSSPASSGLFGQGTPSASGSEDGGIAQLLSLVLKISGDDKDGNKPQQLDNQKLPPGAKKKLKGLVKKLLKALGKDPSSTGTRQTQSPDFRK